MFKSQEVLDLRVSADFTRLNGAPTKEESGSAATIDFRAADGVAPIPANIIARGNARFRSCGFRPFTIKFSEKQKDNAFEHLGKSVKFVTHCGDKEGMSPIFKADSIEAYEQRVIMEHAVYQVLDQLGVPSLKTRLVRLTYHDTATAQEETHLAFVREPEDEMAERCGMVELEEAGNEGPLLPNAYSDLVLNFLNGFVIQSDWTPSRNVIRLVNTARKEVFYAPYDFDLVGIFRPDYFGNKDRTIEQNRDDYADWLRRNQSPALFGEIDVMLDGPRREGMWRAIGQSGMSEPNLRVFSRWLDLYLGLLEDFRGCKCHAGDPSRPTCYVQDEHGASPETATHMALGQWTTRLEPPGDVDMFAVQLDEGAIYTLGGDADLELVDDRGNLLASFSEGSPAVSVRSPLAGTVYLRASLGERLVASSLYAAWQIDRKVFMYADDHGASIETATPLAQGQSVQGNWEVYGDEDWLQIRADSSNSLHVQVAPSGLGRVEVVRRPSPDGGDGSDGALPAAEADLYEGDNELPSLFEQPGDYIVKLIGASADMAYTVELR